jgi:hypothetical protein
MAAAQTLPPLITGDCLVQSGGGKARGRFSVEKLRKRLLTPLHGMWPRPPASGQKFFASFFQKRSSFFL